MTKDTGITSLYPSVADPEEERLQAEAKAAVMKRLNVSDTPTPLQSAADRLSEFDSGTTHITFKPDFYKTTKTKKELEKEKFKKYMEKEYGDEAIKKDVLKKVQKNKQAGKGPYEGMSTANIIVAEDVKDKAKAKLAALKNFGIEESSTKVAGYPKEPSIQQQVINYSPTKVPQKNKKILPIKGGVTVDPKHPDGFRLTEDEDIYRHYGDTPVRYIEEIMYKYEDDAPTPKETIKKFNGMDKSSFPSNPTQKKLLTKYENIYSKLNPAQKRQLVSISRKK